MLNSLLSHLDTSASLVVHLQRHLTEIPALAPENKGDGEEQKAQWLKGYLEQELKLNVVTCDAPDARVSSGVRPNLITTIPGKTKQTLWVISHMDVVPAGEDSLWETPPFTLTQEGDILIGRGVEDNQQGIVTSLLVAEALVKHNITPDIGLGIILVADEEAGMTHGLPYILKTMPHLIAKDDLIVVPDIGNSRGNMVQLAEKSVLWLKFTVNGKQCHASSPDEGKNSLVISSHCVIALKDLHTQFPACDEIFDPAHSTFVPTKKEANVENINTLPGKDVFYMDCRVLPCYFLEDVQQACTNIAKTVAQKFNADIHVEAVNVNPNVNATAASAPVVQKLCKALQADRSLTPKLCGSSGQTVATILRNNGYDAVAWSTLLDNAHQPNERSSIAFTIADARIIMRMLYE